MAIAYNTADKDAEDTRKLVEAEGKHCLVLKGDVGDKHTCMEWVERTVKDFGRLDIIVNNAAVQKYNDNVLSCAHTIYCSTYRSLVRDVEGGADTAYVPHQYYWLHVPRTGRPPSPQTRYPPLLIFIAHYSSAHTGVGSSIINTHSVVAYKGSAGLIDYSTTKGTNLTACACMSAALYSSAF